MDEETKAVAKTEKYEVQWQLNSDANGCAVCAKKFGIWRRRHHCRSCGRLVCDACSTTRRPVPGTSNLKRVCDSCVNNELDGARRGDGDAWHTLGEEEGGYNENAWEGSDRGHWRTTMD